MTRGKAPPPTRALVAGVARVLVVIALLVVAARALDAAAPWALRLPGGTSRALAGAALVLAGVSLECAGTRALWTQGAGTPNPRAAPSRLVTRGAYAWSRNPLYVARVSALAGIGLVLASPGVLAVTVTLATALHAWLVPREEARLRARHGDAFDAYASRVRRWAGRRRGATA